MLSRLVMSLEGEVTGREEEEEEGGGGTELMGSTVTDGSYGRGEIGSGEWGEWGGCVEDSGEGGEGKENTVIGGGERGWGAQWQGEGRRQNIVGRENDKKKGGYRDVLTRGSSFNGESEKLKAAGVGSRETRVLLAGGATLSESVSIRYLLSLVERGVKTYAQDAERHDLRPPPIARRQPSFVHNVNQELYYLHGD